MFDLIHCPISDFLFNSGSLLVLKQQLCIFKPCWSLYWLLTEVPDFFECVDQFSKTSVPKSTSKKFFGIIEAINFTIWDTITIGIALKSECLIEPDLSFRIKEIRWLNFNIGAVIDIDGLIFESLKCANRRPGKFISKRIITTSWRR